MFGQRFKSPNKEQSVGNGMVISVLSLLSRIEKILIDHK